MASRLSLRIKLTLWYLSVFALIQVTLLGAIILYRQDSIRESFDDGLQRGAESLAQRLSTQEWPLSTQNLADIVPASAGFQRVAVRDRNQRVLVSLDPEGVDPIPFSPSAHQRTGVVGHVFTTVEPDATNADSELGERLRAITLPFIEREGVTLFLQAAVPFGSLRRLLGNYSDLLFLGLPIGLFAASMAAWIIAGKAVAPYHEFSVAARAISPTNPSVQIDSERTHQEISRLNDELNLALGRMDAGYRAQEQFISNVSHELRTPISVILTESQVLKRKNGSANDGEYHQYVLNVEEEMQRLGRLVESFLTLSRTEMGQDPFTPQVVSVTDIVLDAVQHCFALAKLHQVHLIPNLEIDDIEEAEIECDPDLLRTVLDNLIRNAIRFSPSGSEVDVDVTCARGEAVFSVRDRGPGLPEEYMERIFERFVQVPDSSARANGTGLGLAITSRIVQLHSGSIHVQNNDDLGCSFVVKIPLTS